MSLDPAVYELAEQPWGYNSVAGILNAWGYKPVGDHAKELWEVQGSLRWLRIDPDTGARAAFVISSPKWRANGLSEPVWPAKVIVNALAAQGVFLRTGDGNGSGGIAVTVVRNC